MPLAGLAGAPVLMYARELLLVPKQVRDELMEGFQDKNELADSRCCRRF
jgi:hypothetical protein